MADCSNCEHRKRCEYDGRIQNALLGVGRQCPLNIGGDDYAFEIEKRIAEYSANGVHHTVQIFRMMNEIGDNN